MNTKLFLKRSFFFFLFSIVVCEENKEAEGFVETLRDNLTELVSERIKTNKRDKKYKISKKVKSEINKQIFHDSKKTAKKKAYKKRGEKFEVDFLKDDFFIYKLPKWPFYSLVYESRGILQVDLIFDFVTQSYSSSGGIQDLSKLVFGQKDMTISDILLVSKLLYENKVNPAGGVDLNKLYFYILADQSLVFDASMNKQTVSINYARHFARGDISWGFQIPIVRRENKIRLSSDIDNNKKAKLCGATQGVNSGPDFYKIHDNLEGFLSDILGKKGLEFNKEDIEIGLGDLSTFINFEIDWEKCERLVTGFNFIFPSAKDRDTNKLWDPELGGDGFIQMALFGSILFGNSRAFNPHIFVQVSVEFPKSVKRRVPKLISYDSVTPAIGTPTTKKLIYGEYALYKDAFTDEPDTQVRRFGDHAKKIKMYPSPDFFIRVGNIFERFLFKQSFLDIFYDFLIKGKDYLKKKSDSEEYYKTVLTQNSSKIAHTLGLNYSHQFDEHFRLNFGGRFTFAGRNVERLFQLNLSLNAEF